ncbi:heterokaryon incompatibility protein-domain-containing protein [Podospora australis]|uniref:Heterokaryon incompatibility protein-domain-containing protein n=1 Tax=Podospora australis TaxID=1536484 RepID=A0AAN7AH05_9PEZI|nr:heterokaryon incompatibility protein-domain-containing protein [Podospora australis]
MTMAVSSAPCDNNNATSVDNPIYHPLPLQSHLRETRVVYLESGLWNDTISCRLETVALGVKPRYEALSYVWGDSSETMPILLNGHIIKVGANLASALRHLRSTTHDRPLWADAVCIDQRNIRERNEQVALMRDIYSQSQGVIIWLGDKTDWAHSQQSEQTLPCVWMSGYDETWPSSVASDPNDQSKIATFHSEVKDYYRLPFALRQSLRIDNVMGTYCLINQLAQNRHINSDEIPLLGNHDAFHKIIDSLRNLMSRPWWMRQWVIQEVVLPPTATVYMGKFVAPWGMFAHAARNYDYHRKVCCQSHYVHLHGNDIRTLELFSKTVVELDDLRQSWQMILKDNVSNLGVMRISLRQLLWQFRNRETSDARDKVFALFPLVNHWGKHIAMYPEYRWTPQEIYRVTVEKIITIDESLLVLMGSTDKRLPGLSTWVPDWTSQPPKFELERLERMVLFKSSGSEKLEARFMGELYLELSGVRFDRITAVSETMKYDEEHETLGIFASWYNLFSSTQKADSDYVAGGTRLEAYWRTLCLDTCRSLGKEEVSLDKGQRYRRCSPEYVRDCMELWMDRNGLPLVASAHNGQEAVANSTGPRSTSSTGLNNENGDYHGSPDIETHRDEPRRPITELTKHENLNFVAVDFAITSATIQRKLFFTQKGYIGLGPENMKEGDGVYVFAGGHTPFVVRDGGQRVVPYIGEQLCRELIGDCYAHGIMDGELVTRGESVWEKLYLM